MEQAPVEQTLGKKSQCLSPEGGAGEVRGDMLIFNQSLNEK